MNSPQPNIIAIYLRDLVGGGFERVMLNLSRELLKRGFHVDILLEEKSGEFIDLLPPGAQCIVLSEHAADGRTRFRTGNDFTHKIALTFTTLLRKIYNVLYYNTGKPRFLYALKTAISDYRQFKFGYAGAWVYFRFLSKVEIGYQRRLVLRNLCRYLNEKQPCVVFTGLEDQSFALILSKYLSGIPSKYIVSIRNHLSTYFPLTYPLPFHKNYGRALTYLYAKADAVVAVSEEIRTDAIENFRIPPEIIKVIYNPVVNDSLAAFSPGSTEDDDWLHDDIPVILAAGRLYPHKDFPTLLRAFAEVKKEIEARLIILGEGPEREKLQILIADLGLQNDVRIPGFKEDPFSYMAKSSLFVLSSANEGLPGVLIQAMACGCPVVSTDCRSGPLEILEGGKWGILVPVGDHTAMARNIIHALGAKHDKEQLIRRASYFSAGKAVSDYLDLFNLSDSSAYKKAEKI